MTWSYDPELLERKDEVRNLVGDVDTTDQLVQDEEIVKTLGYFPPDADKPAWLAAAHTADTIAGRFARAAQQSIGALSESAQQRFEHYRLLAADLRALYASNGRSVTGMSGIVPAGPILSGGGRTYLGGTPYANPEGN